MANPLKVRTSKNPATIKEWFDFRPGTRAEKTAAADAFANDLRAKGHKVDVRYGKDTVIVMAWVA